ncbi:hypothetical protein B0H10DRAFT_2065785 [Mycena sp. CBHHK59/15]|nr:hypothetical protein B0H10DRAFT_2065785 [Mycena sp. CBHHK59/15]
MPRPAYLLKPISIYAPPPAHPLKSTVSYDYLSPADELCIKRWLSNRLHDPQTSLLPHMPGGFPFHYLVDGRGRGSLSLDSYEFCEEIPSNIFMSGPSRRYWVTFSYTNHAVRSRYASHDHRDCPFSHRPKHYMSWRAYVAVRDMSYCRSETENFPLLHVELDPTVLSTSYGHLLANYPKIILRAMGVSLDKGLPITIKLADYSHPRDVLFFGTDAKGRRELLHRSKLRISQS